MKTICSSVAILLVFTLNFASTLAQWDYFAPSKTTKKPVVKPAPNPEGRANDAGPSFFPASATAPVQDAASVQQVALGPGGSGTGDKPLIKADVLKAGNIAEVLALVGATSFLQLLQQNNLLEQLKGKDEFTVFAPTNIAIAGLPKWGLRKIVQDPTLLGLMLTYHIAPGKTVGANFTNGLRIVTNYTSRPVHIGLTTHIAANHAVLILPDSMASNGVVHVINSALFPLPAASLFQILEDSPSFSKFKKFVLKAGLDVLLKHEGNALTMFVPTNDAFAVVPNKVKVTLSAETNASADVTAKIQALILHHIVKGINFSPAFYDGQEVLSAADRELVMGVRIDPFIRLRDVSGARVLRPDIVAVNGVVHAIDHFLVYDEIY